MKITATVRTEEIYEFNINGKIFSEFKIESDWEGFVKFVNKSGLTIVACVKEASIIPFNMRLDFSVNPKDDFFIIKASPEIIEATIAPSSPPINKSNKDKKIHTHSNMDDIQKWKTSKSEDNL